MANNRNDLTEAQRRQLAYDRAVLSEKDGPDMNDLASDAFKDGARALERAKIGETTKFYGVTMDAGIAGYLSSINNVLTDYANTYLAPAIDRIVRERVGPQLNLEGAALSRTAAAATLAGAVALKAGKDISALHSGILSGRRDREKIARALAPVLDDIKGKHSVSVFNGISEAQNEVIYAHRQRMAKISHTTNMGNLISMAINAGPNLLMDVKDFNRMWHGEKHADAVKARLAEDQKQLQEQEATKGADPRQLMRMLINTTSGQVADRIQKSNEAKLRATLQPYSALEMILELDKQVKSDPKASSYAVPKVSGGRQNSYPLEEYIIRILIQHQKDMSDISPDHTELREALKADLAAVAKPIAKAIRNGDMDALQLVRLVGEGKIIKNRGRAVVSASEIETLITKEVPKQTGAMHTDVKEYFANSAFTRDDNKAIGKLQGEEFLLAASWEPDEVLAEAGVSAERIQQVRQWAGKQIETHGKEALSQYEEGLLTGLAALNAKSDEELHKTLSEKEIKHVREAYKKVEHEGVHALRELKTSPKNAQGIERELSNWAVNVIKDDKQYFGTVLQNGRKEAAALLAGGGEADIDRDAPNTLAKHTKNGISHGSKELGDGAEGGHAARVRQRAAERTHHGERSFD